MIAVVVEGGHDQFMRRQLDIVLVTLRDADLQTRVRAAWVGCVIWQDIRLAPAGALTDLATGSVTPVLTACALWCFRAEALRPTVGATEWAARWAIAPAMRPSRWLHPARCRRGRARQLVSPDARSYRRQGARPSTLPEPLEREYSPGSLWRAIDPGRWFSRPLNPGRCTPAN